MKNSSATLTDRQKSRMKTSADIEIRTSGRYSGNSYTERYLANKNLICRRRYFSLDICRNAGSKTQIEKTNEETCE